jgi:starch phosphorylase
MHQKLKIAYFSMEFGLQDWMKTWCGGLGILAGDTIKSATDLGISMTGITLLHKNGWFKQIIDQNSGQREEKDTWNYFSNLRLLPQRITLDIWDRTVTLAIWEYNLTSNSGFTNQVFFLDSDIPENNDWDRNLTNDIYPTNYDIFLTQETLLGIGGIKLLQALGLYEKISVFHLNESHCMSTSLALKKELGSWKEVRQKICFTTHTPLAGGHQKETLEKLQYFIPKEYLEEIPTEVLENKTLNFTTMCIFAAKFTNGVSKRHRDTTAKMYPNYTIDFVTNGVHPTTWISHHLIEVFDNYLGTWRSDVDNLKLAKTISNEDYQKAHDLAKQDLLSVINLHSSLKFETNVFTIGFARRAAPYKRADLIFSQFDRLHQIASKFGAIQLVFAGKALPGLEESNQIIKSLVERSKQSDLNLRIVFLPNYGIKLSQLITGGVDLWLNNPLPPLEASGTSGMKAAINGAPNFSIMDGWWPEACVEGQTGWSIGEDLCEGDQCRLEEVSDLYDKLEQKILPLYYNDKEKWLEICKNNIAEIGSKFNTHKMLLEYVQKGYLKEF